MAHSWNLAMRTAATHKHYHNTGIDSVAWEFDDAENYEVREMKVTEQRTTIQHNGKSTVIERCTPSSYLPQMDTIDASCISSIFTTQKNNQRNTYLSISFRIEVCCLAHCELPM